jgi:hypothetical protein
MIHSLDEVISAATLHLPFLVLSNRLKRREEGKKGGQGRTVWRDEGRDGGKKGGMAECEGREGSGTGKGSRLV